MRSKIFFPMLFLLIAAVQVSSGPALAQGGGMPTIDISLGSTSEPGQIATGLKIMLILTVLSLAPSIFISLTSFVRIIIVVHFLRQAMGTQTMPPNQVVAGLAMFMTFFIMAPAFTTIYNDAFIPFSEEKIGAEVAYTRAMEPMRDFMLRQTREKDLSLFVEMSTLKKPESIDDVPIYVIIPSFIISEMRTSFTIGFLIYIPFLVLDMVIASVLMSMGMMMLPPIMISLPFKLMLFVLVDGWHLIVGSLLRSFG